MKKLLIFDAYGTLISTGTGSVDSSRKILSLQDNNIDPVLFYNEWKKIHRLNVDLCNEKEFMTEWNVFEKDLKCLYEKYNINRPYNEDVKIMYETQYNRKVFDDVLSTINELKKHYRVVIGSTTDSEPLLKNMKENNLIVDEVYTSEKIKKYKPAKEFYEYILKKEKISAKDTVFIGDSLIDDVLGPSKLNITTILIDRNNKYQKGEIIPDYIITSLKELIKLKL